MDINIYKALLEVKGLTFSYLNCLWFVTVIWFRNSIPMFDATDDLFQQKMYYNGHK